ncbi:MAG: gliding motility-associated C-terminal domain-containing protein [Saprospiraceae bacterium]|nr:gliding motility-associated C-terminal domain-containing protein [Saprospiraceae bacterium]
MSQIDVLLGPIIQAANDSLYFNAGRLYGSLDINGKLGSIYSKNVTSLFLQNNMLVDYNKSLFSGVHTVNTDNPDITNIVLSRLDYDKKEIWSKKLVHDDILLNKKNSKLNAVKFNQDSTLLLCGTVDSTHSFIAISDTLGNLLWSKSYSDEDPKKSIPTILDGVRLADSTFLLVGYVTEFFVTNAVQDSRGLIIKLDTIGNIIWSKKVQFDEKDQTSLSNIVIDKNGDLLVSGYNFDVSELYSYPFIAKINKDGDVIWKYKYNRTNHIYIANSLFTTQDGGAAVYHSADKDQGKSVTSFIKIDNTGSTTCQTPIDENIILEDEFKSDTLKWVSTNFGMKDSLVNLQSKKHKYKVPEKMGIIYFCPNVPIDTFLVSKHDGATNYKWSTGLEGASADSLRVMKEGEYTVMVTINKDICFVFCDTAKIERYKEPTVSIILDLGNFCTSGKQTLKADVNGGKPEYTYTWSTGETSESIEIANPGTYSVTIVDQCNETADAKIVVGPFPTKITAATITDQIAVNCLNGTLTGTLTAQGNSTGFKEPETYQWNNGSKTKEISINDSDILTFTVTVTDGCGTTATATKVIELKGAGVKSVKISKTGSGDCKDRIITLNAVTEVSGSYTYVWSNGVKTANFTTDQPGTFSVTVTDKCGNSATDSSIITKEDFEPADLAYANIFFPDGADLISRSQIPAEDSVAIKQAITTARYNRTFGPIPLKVYCLDEITNYEFYVFNRWGQLVFESKSVTDEWDGEHKDEKAPTETYMWVTKYTVLGIEKVVKGSVTLLRP